MKIPKYIKKLLDRRESLACKLNSCSVELDDWLEKNGADLLSPDISGAVLSGCMIYCEPIQAKLIVISYILNEM